MSSSSSTAFTPLLPAPVGADATLRGGLVTGIMDTPELRSGEWTRFGPDSVLGDDVTEGALSALVEHARAAARSQGYAVGWAQGRREAADEAAMNARARDREAAEERRTWSNRQDAAVRALEHAAQQLASTMEDARTLVAAQAIELARELTEAMVGHELRNAPDTAADIVAKVLAACPGDRPFVVRLHPDVVDSAASSALFTAGVRLLADPGLGAADAVVEVDDQVLDLRLSSALARVREVLA